MGCPMNEYDANAKKIDLLKSSHEYDLVDDDRISSKVTSHLLTRHVQLLLYITATREHKVHETLLKEYGNITISPKPDRYSPANAVQTNTAPDSSSKHPNNHPEVRAYKLAVTDLFVEKAQAILEEKAEIYQFSGKTAHRFACTIIVAGAIFACYQMIVQQNNFATSWLALTSSFTRAFTAYGMIVLAAVGLWRYGKANLDQAERLLDRRHALRQGRLFVHLSDGELNIDDMLKAFNWNVSQENAFASIHTEASAPWGVVLKEMARNAPELYKAIIQSASKGKGDEDKKA